MVSHQVKYVQIVEFQLVKNHINIRKWTCLECDYTHDRDINALINIRNYALGQVDI